MNAMNAWPRAHAIRAQCVGDAFGHVRALEIAQERVMEISDQMVLIRKMYV